MPDPLHVYDDVVAFLKMPQLLYAPIKTIRGVTKSSISSAFPSLSLFEYMLAQKAEIRAQEALFPYLLSKYQVVEREYKCNFSAGSPKKYYKVDFIVADDEALSNPVVIELKHYSPHQSGGLATLLGTKPGFNLLGDYEKIRSRFSPLKNTPLIQIGLYTAVETFHLNPGTWHAHQANAFIKTYVRSPVTPSIYGLAADEALAVWPHLAKYNPYKGFVMPDPSSKSTAPSAWVDGRVNYFVGLAPSYPHDR